MAQGKKDRNVCYAGQSSGERKGALEGGKILHVWGEKR